MVRRRSNALIWLHHTVFHAKRLIVYHARAGRCMRDYYAVQLSSGDDHSKSGSSARSRLRCRHQAPKRDSIHSSGTGEAGRTSCYLSKRNARLSHERPRSSYFACYAPACAEDQLHWIDECRQDVSQACGTDTEEGQPGAWGQCTFCCV